jgi:beta-N-acetylhexosaminidase
MLRGHFLWLVVFPLGLFAQSWAEKSLTLEEKIGQLFMLPACPLLGKDHQSDWALLLDRFRIGNAIVKHSDPVTQVHFLNDLQSASKIPMLIAADAEWGLAMRMKETMAFPKNRPLGSVKNLDLLFQFGAEIGRQAKRVGIHLNLAPVADVNTNPENPIIGMRSFGEDPIQVAKCVSAVIRGMQSEGIGACAKHFPGHGDTVDDSHRTLPLVPHSLERLHQIEFVPFQQAIRDGCLAIMTAHLLVPAIDPYRAATLSPSCLTAILRHELGFEGLIVSDALNMKALAMTPEEIATLAFQAGCDLLLYGDHIAPRIDKILREDIPRAWTALKRGFEDGSLSIEQLDASVARILRAKERLGLHLGVQVTAVGLAEALHSEEAILFKKRLFREAVFMQGDLPPLPEKTAYLAIGAPGPSQEFWPIHYASPNLNAAERLKILKDLEGYDAVLIGVHKFGPREENYGFSPDCLDLVRSMPGSVLCLFGTPDAASLFAHQGPLLMAFENDPDAQEAALEILRKARR